MVIFFVRNKTVYLFFRYFWSFLLCYAGRNGDRGSHFLMLDTEGVAWNSSFPYISIFWLEKPILQVHLLCKNRISQNITYNSLISNLRPVNDQFQAFYGAKIDFLLMIDDYISKFWGTEHWICWVRCLLWATACINLFVRNRIYNFVHRL